MYYLVFGLLYLFSLLPLRVLFLLSSVLYFIIYKLAGYRKKVVFENLQRAFPEKSPREIETIARKFYLNLADSFVETLKLMSAGDKWLKRHFKGDFSLFEDLYAKGKKCQIHTNHNFNWEWANNCVALHIPFTLLTVYMPLSNKVFDRIFMYMRKRTGAILLPATDMRNAILPYRNIQYALALVADQSPGNPTSGYWVEFLGKPAPFVRGAESGARRGNIPVVFSYFTKPRRGYYTIHFELAEEFPESTEAGELTARYVSFLEQVIRYQPALWLWSHRRWKWEYREEYGPLLPKTSYSISFSDPGNPGSK